MNEIRVSRLSRLPVVHSRAEIVRPSDELAVGSGLIRAYAIDEVRDHEHEKQTGTADRAAWGRNTSARIIPSFGVTPGFPAGNDSTGDPSISIAGEAAHAATLVVRPPLATGCDRHASTADLHASANATVDPDAEPTPPGSLVLGGVR